MSAPTFSSDKICCATKLFLPSFAPSYQTGLIWGSKLHTLSIVWISAVSSLNPEWGKGNRRLKFRLQAPGANLFQEQAPRVYRPWCKREQRPVKMNSQNTLISIKSVFQLFFYKNLEAEISPDNKNVLRTFIRLRVLLSCILNDKHKGNKKCTLTQMFKSLFCITWTMVFLLHDIHLGLQ